MHGRSQGIFRSHPPPPLLPPHFAALESPKILQKVNKISIGSWKLPHTLFFRFKEMSCLGDSFLFFCTETAFFKFTGNLFSLLKHPVKLSAYHGFLDIYLEFGWFCCWISVEFWICSWTFCCGYKYRFMAIAYFCRRASSWMSFERILNTTLPSTLLEFKGGHRRTFPPLVTQGNFGLTVPVLINTNHRNKKIKSLTDFAFPFPWVTPGTKFVWLYHWYLYCLCRLWTQVSIKINNNLMKLFGKICASWRVHL